MKKMLLIMAAILAIGLASCSHGSYSHEDNPYITFKSTKPFKILINDPGWLKPENPGTVEYSTDTENAESWTVWETETKEASAAQSTEDGCYYLYFRGTGNNVIAGHSTHNWKITGLGEPGTAECYGDIRTLLDYNNPDRAKMGEACFCAMFYDCTGLTSAPELPANVLADNCYSCMFYGCTELTSAPELPAATLAVHCYSCMFYGCTELTSAPELPANVLKMYCYYYMFYECTGLTSAPKLPATALVSHCYDYMFYGCTSLKIGTADSDEQCFLEMPDDDNINDKANSMFSATGGSFVGTPEKGKRYYYY